MEGLKMRVGTFLLGGIAGAAAVIYLNRKSKSWMLSAFNSSNASMGNMMDKAKNNFTGKTSSTGNVGKAATSLSSSNSLDSIGHIVNNDPSVKGTVNEILADNKAHTPTIQ
jgi:hypothetical protein